MPDTEITLAIAATTAAGLFAGSALYITAVQHPALQAAHMPSGSRAAFFRLMFGSAAPLQASLAGLSGAAAITTGVLGKQRESGQVTSSSQSTLWMASGVTIVAIIPYTFVTMMKLNKRLIDPEYCAKEGDQWLTQSLARWGRLHSVRTAVSVVAFAGMAVALSGTATTRGEAIQLM